MTASLLLEFRVKASVSGVRRELNWEIDGENEPQQTSWLVFREALDRSPTSWVPPCTPSPVPPSCECRPTRGEAAAG